MSEHNQMHGYGSGANSTIDYEDGWVDTTEPASTGKGHETLGTEGIAHDQRAGGTDGDERSMAQKAGGVIDGVAERIEGVATTIKSKFDGNDESDAEAARQADRTLVDDEMALDYEYQATEASDIELGIETDEHTDTYASDQQMGMGKHMTFEGAGNYNAEDEYVEDDSPYARSHSTPEQLAEKINDSYGMRQRDRDEAAERVQDIEREITHSFEGEVAV